MVQLRAHLQDLDMTVTEQTSSHHNELTRHDELIAKYTADVRTLEDKLKHSEQQVVQSVCVYLCVFCVFFDAAYVLYYCEHGGMDLMESKPSP